MNLICKLFGHKWGEWIPNPFGFFKYIRFCERCEESEFKKDGY